MKTKWVGSPSVTALKWKTSENEHLKHRLLCWTHSSALLLSDPVSQRLPLTIWVSSGLCKHIHFPPTEAQERTCLLSDKDISLLSRLLSLTHTPWPKAGLWSQSSQELALTPKPSPDSFYPGQGVKLPCVLCVHDGERQGPWEGDLDPDVRSQQNMSITLSVVQESSYRKNVYVSRSGALNMIK